MMSTFLEVWHGKLKIDGFPKPETPFPGDDFQLEGSRDIGRFHPDVLAYLCQ